jgi:hypothetical protein
MADPSNRGARLGLGDEATHEAQLRVCDGAMPLQSRAHAKPTLPARRDDR